MKNYIALLLVLIVISCAKNENKNSNLVNAELQYYKSAINRTDSLILKANLDLTDANFILKKQFNSLYLKNEKLKLISDSIINELQSSFQNANDIQSSLTTYIESANNCSEKEFEGLYKLKNINNDKILSAYFKDDESKEVLKNKIILLVKELQLANAKHLIISPQINSLSYNSGEIIVVPKKSEVVVGEKFEAKVYLATIDTTSIPKLYYSTDPNSQLQVEDCLKKDFKSNALKDGSALISETFNSKGIKKIIGWYRVDTRKATRLYPFETTVSVK